jgi:hypothetical protein
MEKGWASIFPSVKPQPITLNSTPLYRWETQNGESALEKYEEVGYVVPFLQALQQFLGIKTVYEAVNASYEKNKTRLRSPPTQLLDIWDGRAVLENPVFIRQEGQVLGIQVYYDEVELANALGTAAGRNKTGFFYWSLMNLPPEWRSNLRSIQLLAIVNSDLLKKYGAKKLLQPFLDDLQKLECGIDFEVRGKCQKWHGFIINCVGDMPASNFIGGFKISASAHLPCRICFISQDNMCATRESQCRLRDKVIHEQQVTEISDPSITNRRREELSRNYGINGPSLFSTLSYFDPTTHLPNDIMHLLFEGLLNSGTGLILNILLRDGLNLDVVNQRISQLKSTRQYTKPPVIRQDEVIELKKLSFSSSEMSSLATVLPIVLGEYCSVEDNAYYANFILLLQITASLLAYGHTEFDLNFLESNIHYHNLSFSKLYPQCPITPKLHALLHVVEQIRLFGPPRYSWCFRYESKNAPFKKVWRRNCNFRNPAYTLASNHQKLVAFDIAVDGESNFFGDQVEIEKQSEFDMLITNYKWAYLLNDTFPLESKMHSISKLKIAGRTCGIDSVFLRTNPTRQLPTFWKIADIFFLQGKVFIIFQSLTTCFFSRDHFSFLVNPTEEFSVIHVDDVTYKVPLQAFQYCGNVYVVPNYYHMYFE